MKLKSFQMTGPKQILIISKKKHKNTWIFKKHTIFALAKPLSDARRNGRVVECGGLENR